MIRNNRIYDDDDGRTIADMSDVYSPSAFLPRKNQKRQSTEPEKPQNPWEKTGFSRKERLMITLGVLKGSMLIAMAYILGLGLIVGLVCLLGK